MSYEDFLRAKSHYGADAGFEPLWMPDYLFDFQKALVAWITRKARGAIFADCGMGKTVIELVWAENVVRKEKKPILIVTPLAVSYQTVLEGKKFGIDCMRSRNGKVAADITVTNYELLHLFDAGDFIGVVCDESSILKNFNGVRRGIITEFLRTMPYRLLCTATAAPNDYIELGTTSEALGELGYTDMLARFFKNDAGFARIGGDAPKWRFKKHAEKPFWRWVCSWARALRNPSDMGFSDGDFILPPLLERQTIVESFRPFSGELFQKIAVNLREQREERRLTIQERCEKVAEIVGQKSPALVWCHLNSEGDLLEQLISDGIQISGADSDERKEEVFLGFASGHIRVIVTKPKIGAFGLNFQHCSQVTFFPSHSWEQYYQGVRRCWRFGQTRPVAVDVVTTPGEITVLKNLQRKAHQAERMFSELISYMNDSLQIEEDYFPDREIVPAWL